ncbi:MAG: hypothetical protein SFY69_00765 [Planctomycetota bacterium]|nr:hypothetical protein [Planctomycetota bacterium]
MSNAPDAKQPAPAEPAPAEPAKKKPPIKLLGAVGAVMVIEGLAVFMVAKMTSPQPVAAETTLHEEDHADGEAAVEVSLLEDRFQNMQTGRVWVWDAQIVLKVRAKNQSVVEAALESRAAELQEGVALIFRRAQHSHLKEPGLETLNRQLTAYLNGVLGQDAEGKPRLERVMIPRCKGFPAD